MRLLLSYEEPKAEVSSLNSSSFVDTVPITFSLVKRGRYHLRRKSNEEVTGMPGFKDTLRTKNSWKQSGILTMKT